MIWSQCNSCIFHLHYVWERTSSVHWGAPCRLKHLLTRKGIDWWSGECVNVTSSANSQKTNYQQCLKAHECRQTEIFFYTFVYKLYIKTWPGHHYTLLFTRRSNTGYDPSLYTMSQFTNQYKILLSLTRNTEPSSANPALVAVKMQMWHRSLNFSATNRWWPFMMFDMTAEVNALVKKVIKHSWAHEDNSPDKNQRHLCNIWIIFWSDLWPAWKLWLTPP